MQFPGLTTYCDHKYNKSGRSPIDWEMVGVGIVSDSFAIFGAIFIIITYFLFKDLKTRARQFLALIAVADLFNAIFYFIGQTCYLVNKDYTLCYVNKSAVEIGVCVGQAAANNLFSLLSFSFTIILSFHILFIFIGRNILYKKKYFYFSIILGFVFPFLITSFAFWFGWFGPGETVTIGWCFIRDFPQNVSAGNIKSSAVYELLTGKLWDIITIVVISFVYILIIFRCLWKRQGKQSWRNIGEQDFKIFLIPIIFVFLRIWGEIHLFWTYFHPNINVPPPLLYLQAIFEPSQGWANAIIYIFWTKNVRKRILRICSFRKRKFYQNLNHGDSSSGEH